MTQRKYKTHLCIVWYNEFLLFSKGPKNWYSITGSTLNWCWGCLSYGLTVETHVSTDGATAYQILHVW